jgi:hypothetical protein
MATNWDESATHTELRALMMLLTLVSALNGSESTFKRTEPAQNQIGDIYERKSFTALSALATILVQDTEIVAVTTLRKLPEELCLGVLSVDPADGRDHQSRRSVEYLDDASFLDDLTYKDILRVQRDFATGFTAVSNPDHRDEKRYFSEQPGHHICISGPGTSRWPFMKNLDNNYDVLDMK